MLVQSDGTCYAVLGDLLELGDEEVDQHIALGVYAHANGVDRLLACGDLCKHTVDAFGTGAEWFESKERIVDTLCRDLTAESTVLVKGSRSMKMEEVVAGVTEQRAEACC